MNQDKPKLVVIFGGAGFLGRHVVRILAKNGLNVRIACRRPDLAEYTRVLGNVGQIQLAQTNVRNKKSIQNVIQDADVVVNLVGILAETGKQKFQDVHTKAASDVASEAKKINAKIVHVSAVGADDKSEIKYIKSKAKGENAVKKHGGIIIRPSVIFGAEDKFFNLFARIATLSPVIPIIGGDTKFQPVYVGDVAQAIATAVQQDLPPESVWEVGGPDVMTMRECIELMLNVIGRKRIVLNIPFPIARAIARITQFVPTKPLTPEQVEMLKQDNVVQKNRNNLKAMGIIPKSVSEIIPEYMVRFKKHGQFGAQTKITV